MLISLSHLSYRVCDWIFILPALCDIAGSTLQGKFHNRLSLVGIGLMYIDASVWQMLRGSIIVFAGILSVVFLKRRLLYFQWVGMLVTVCGLALVGAASLFEPSAETFITSPAHAALGVFLVLLGSFATASQIIVEEVFLKKKNYLPLHVVGMEGFFGVFVMGFIILPIIHHSPGADLNGSFENQLDAIFQTMQSPALLFTSILLILSIAFFNYFGLAITHHLSAVHRSLLDALRSIFIWITSIFLFYVVGHQYGEPFHSGWSLVEIDGFALLVMGTLIFNKTLRLDCLPCAPPYSADTPTTREETSSVDSLTAHEGSPLLGSQLPTSAGTFDAPTSQVVSVNA
ncbi:unnamed protein product [Mesocestoides corti]|uniref:EamA domain-containing protein n=1 Tax=Mesocestoides corti TaxID=53468 RepID=A0A0R3UQB9_MESCO|nr:unnamed protein product [Mesocestoides corti]